MARGIIAVKSASGTGAGSTGRLIVSEGGVTDPTTVGIDTGTVVKFTEDIKANVGDIVDFTQTADGLAANINLFKTGKVITGNYQDNIVVNNGEAVIINGKANIEGTILVNGGVLAVVDSSYISGKIQSTGGGAYMLIDNTCTIEGKIEVSGASYMSVKNSTIEGKISSNGNTFAAVQGCTVNGKLEVVNAKVCKTFGNTVVGQTNTPGCP